MHSLRPVSFGLAALLLLTSCASMEPQEESADAAEESAEETAEQEATDEQEPTGLGDYEALSGISFTAEEDEAPELDLEEEVEAEEDSALVLDPGDGEPIEPEKLLHLSTAMADPETGEVQEEDFSDEAPSVLYLPMIEEQNEFIYDSITDTGLNVGGEIAMYVPAAESGGQPTLIIVRVDDQNPDHAEGEVEEQSGDLPAVLNEVGEAPELEDFEGEDEDDAPEETESEILIQGDGEEVGPYDHLVVRYTGWQWSDEEIFDSAWPGVEYEGQLDGEDDILAPFDSQLPNLIPGWTEALEGVQVGSRVVMVIPPEQGYGEADDDDDNEHELAGETLIFVVDVVDAVPASEEQIEQYEELEEEDEES